VADSGFLKLNLLQLDIHGVHDAACALTQQNGLVESGQWVHK
jgi:hypothetical protein